MAKEPKNSNSIFLRAFHYIKDNLVIGYSLALLLLVPAAFFVHNYLINTNYGNVIDGITQKKAILAERILNDLVYDKFSDNSALQSLVTRVARENDEIVSLSILKPREGQAIYDVAASSNSAVIGQERKVEPQIFLALTNTRSVAFLDEDSNGRFWKVVRAIRDSEGKKDVGLMEMSLSLAESDIAMNKAITNSYWVLALIVLALVLLQANQIRLMEYALSLNKLKEVDKMKDMFISMASHELRSPLTAIKGYLDLLKGQKNLNLDSESSRYLDNVAASSHRLERLVEDMLEVSRLEGNRFPMEVSDFDPNPLIEQSVEEMRSQAIQKDLILEYLAFPSLVMVKADPSRFKQVVVNLIGNALKYTNKGSVKVTAAIKKTIFWLPWPIPGSASLRKSRQIFFRNFTG